MCTTKLVTVMIQNDNADVRAQIAQDLSVSKGRLNRLGVDLKILNGSLPVCEVQLATGKFPSPVILVMEQTPDIDTKIRSQLIAAGANVILAFPDQPSKQIVARIMTFIWSYFRHI